MLKINTKEFLFNIAEGLQACNFQICNYVQAIIV